MNKTICVVLPLGIIMKNMMNEGQITNITKYLTILTQYKWASTNSWKS